MCDECGKRWSGWANCIETRGVVSGIVCADVVGNSKAFPDVTPGQALCESGFFQTTVFCFKRVCSAVHHPSSPRACVPLDLFLLLFSGRILGVPLSIRCSRSRWAGKKHFRVIGGLRGVGVVVGMDVWSSPSIWGSLRFCMRAWAAVRSWVPMTTGRLPLSNSQHSQLASLGLGAFLLV